MHKRIYHFLIMQGILYDNQYGFRPNHCTTHAICEFTANILNSFDNYMTTILENLVNMLFMDWPWSGSGAISVLGNSL